jgi:hypothetical protein
MRARRSKIFAVDLGQRAAEETREIIAAEGGDATSFTADVSKAQDMESLVDAAL